MSNLTHSRILTDHETFLFSLFQWAKETLKEKQEIPPTREEVIAFLFADIGAGEEPLRVAQELDALLDEILEPATAAKSPQPRQSSAVG